MSMLELPGTPDQVERSSRNSKQNRLFAAAQRKFTPTESALRPFWHRRFEEASGRLS